jgi:homoserine kinase
MNKFRIQVPASSANIGPGFDSVGLAVNLYLTLEVTRQEEWEFISPSVEAGTPFHENFIYKIAKSIADRHEVMLPPCLVRETASIPLARGLGSSAAAIVAGIELANQLGDLKLSQEEKLGYATEIEGHPDNVAPALFGGLVISTMVDDEIHQLKIDELDMDFVFYIPEVELKTTDARDVLPKLYANEEATLASGISNLTFTALVQGDYELAGNMMEKDRFHEPFRKQLIPNYDWIRETAKEMGAYGTVISGAGPTMVSFVPTGKGDAFVEHFSSALADYRIECLKMDVDGLKVTRG